MKPSQLITICVLLHTLLKIEGQIEISTCGKLDTTKRAKRHDTMDLIIRLANGFSSKHHWPWHAAVFHQNENFDPAYKCGGTLISKKSVLTAAHCVHVNNAQLDVEIVTVSLGRLNLAENESSAQSFGVSEILVHPDYNMEGYVNDIAVITMSAPATINSYVQPICLWKSDKTDISEVVGKMGTVIGWGLTKNGELTSKLQQAHFPVVKSFTCIKSNPGFFGEVLTEKSFCAGHQNGTGLCKGDSGGSIVFEENGIYYIRGIVSAGQEKPNPRTQNLDCDSQQYIVFTDVAQFLPWIKEMMTVARDETLSHQPPPATLFKNNSRLLDTTMARPEHGFLQDQQDEKADKLKYCRYDEATQNEYKVFHKIIDIPGARSSGNIVNFQFYVQAERDAHILFTTGPRANREENEYEIVLGAFGGTRILIRRKQQSDALGDIDLPEILAKDKQIPYTIQITTRGHISIFRKLDDGTSKLIANVYDPQPIHVEYVSFGSWDNNLVKFYFSCTFDSFDFEYYDIKDKMKLCRYDSALINEYKNFHKITGIQGARSNVYLADFPFYVRARTDAHVLFTTGPNANRQEKEYEIVIGSHGGSRILIRRMQQGRHISDVRIPDILDEHKWIAYWIQITVDGRIRVFRKRDTESFKLVSEAYDLQPLQIEYISFGSWDNNLVEIYFDCRFGFVMPDPTCFY